MTRRVVVTVGAIASAVTSAIGILLVRAERVAAAPARGAVQSTLRLSYRRVPGTPDSRPNTAVSTLGLRDTAGERTELRRHERVYASARDVIERDPFRIVQPLSVPVALSPRVSGAPHAPRPTLAVHGVVGDAVSGDPHWAAVLTGIPGREGGVLVQRGDTLGGLRIRQVEATRVVVVGADTTWQLLFPDRRP